MAHGVRIRLQRAVVTCVLLVACHALSQPSPMAAAWRHYQALEYDQALASLVDARRAAATPAQLNEVLLLEGFVQVALERKDEALLLFRQVLRNNPGHKLAANTSPKLTAVFDQARTLERERARHRAEVAITLGPPTPPEVASRSVELVAAVTRPFAELSGRVAVENVATHARTWVPLQPEPDGHWRARLPASLVEPNAELSLRAELVHEGEVIASSPSAKEAAIHLMVPRHVAALRIESPMRGALVRVDGRDVGTVPIARLVPTSIGRVHVEVSGDKGTIAQDVDVAAGEVTRVSLKVDSRPRLPVIRYLLLGVGAALLVTGGVLFDQSHRADADYRALVTRDPVTGLPSNQYSTAAPLERNARAYQIAASASVAVGGVAALVGLGLFAVRERRGPPRLVTGAAGVGMTF